MAEILDYFVDVNYGCFNCLADSSSTEWKSTLANPLSLLEFRNPPKINSNSELFVSSLATMAEIVDYFADVDYSCFSKLFNRLFIFWMRINIV